MVQKISPGFVYKFVCFGLLMLICEFSVTAQDPQFSQFYAAPLYLNPAFTGATGQARLGMNYRDQWPAIDANFKTFSLYGDYFFQDQNSGVGFIFNHDTEGLAGLRSASLGLLYSYELFITENLGFRPGVQVALFNRDINFNRLTFGDQYDPATGELINPQTAEQFNTNFSKTFVDLSLGGVFFTKVAYLGIAAFHLTQPNQSIIDEDSPLPIKLSVHGGFKFYMRPGAVGSGIYTREAERSIGPAFQFRHQGQFDQMDLGLYYTAEPLVAGFWYRGVPFKQINGFVNNESLVFLLGFTQIGPKQNWNFGYSFDYTISKLTAGSGGAHEISVTYSFPLRNPRKPPKEKMVIPCPDF